eukprot:3221367-Pleurochrysis_carterae.AAC.1
MNTRAKRTTEMPTPRRLMAAQNLRSQQLMKQSNQRSVLSCDDKNKSVSHDSNVGMGPAPETDRNEVISDTDKVEQEDADEVEESNVVTSLATVMKKSMHSHGVKCDTASIMFYKSLVRCTLRDQTCAAF